MGKGEFVCVADTYWAMPYALWDVPETLYDHLRDSSSLIVVKGDANYRRALGDQPWPLDAPFAEVCSYAPAPLLCLRTLKGSSAAAWPNKTRTAPLRVMRRGSRTAGG